MPVSPILFTRPLDPYGRRQDDEGTAALHGTVVVCPGMKCLPRTQGHEHTALKPYEGFRTLCEGQETEEGQFPVSSICASGLRLVPSNAILQLISLSLLWALPVA